MEPIRVILLDDHAVVREGYRRLIEADGRAMVSGEASDAKEAYGLYKSASADVIVSDISLPGRSGIDFIGQIRKVDPHVKVLIFSMHCSLTFALQAFRAGASGYITKSSPPELLVEAISDVAKGKKAICPEIRELLALSRIDDQADAVEVLSPREFEVLRLLLDARSTLHIADALNVSPKTVSNYHYSIKEKLGCTTDIELMHFGLRNGLVDVND